MNSTKILVATLFTLIILFIMFAISMPVHADWKHRTDIDRMTDEKTTFLYTTYSDDDNRFDLIIPCDYIGIESFTLIVFQTFGLNSFGYEDNDSWDIELLTRFDKKPAQIIKWVSKQGNMLAISNLMNFGFLTQIRKYQTLFIKIHLQPDGYVIAEFDISGFNEAVEKHCN